MDAGPPPASPSSAKFSKRKRSQTQSIHQSKGKSSRPSSLDLKSYASHLDDCSTPHQDTFNERYRKEARSVESLSSPTSESGRKVDEQTLDETRKVGNTGTSSSDENDLEKAEPENDQSSRQSQEKEKDPNVVSWGGPDDPENPKNWPDRQKWIATLVVSSITFITPVSSAIVAPALVKIREDLHITSDVEGQMVLSIFVISFGVGPLFFGPMSELYGRVPVLQLANLFYFVFNTAAGFSKNGSQMLAFRFFSGIGGSAPLGFGAGLMTDFWPPEKRGKALAVYSLAPLLGPVIGPVVGGFVAERSTWRWVFWAPSVVDILLQILGLFLLRETYHPVLLRRKAKRLQKETGNKSLRSEYDDEDMTVIKRLSTSLVRPLILMTTQPIVQVLALYIAYIYGLMYLVVSTFSTLWAEDYHESIGISGVNFVALAIGFLFGAQMGAPLNDRIYRRLKQAHDGVARPEFRAPLLVPGALIVPVGLFWYGWSADAHLHWIMPNIGIAIFSAGVIMSFQCCQTYIVDSYQRYAASCLAAVAVLRSLAGFGLPLFAPKMYRALGYGWGNSLLGFVAIGLGIPAPFCLWFHGAKLRSKSQYAAG